MVGLHRILALGAGCVLAGLSFSASAQSLRFVGSANNIAFQPTCATSSALQINLPSGVNPLTVSTTCNGVAFTCRPLTLPNTGGAVSTVALKSSPTGVSTVELNCAPGATISNLQASVTRFYQTIGDFNLGNSVGGTNCFLVADRVVSSNPSPVFTGDRELRYTCVNFPGGGSPQPVSCYVVDRWSQSTPQGEPRFLRWNAAGTAVLVDDCINSAAGPQNSPYLFEDDMEELTAREAQTISFPQPSTQTFSPSGTFRISASATSGLGVSFQTNTPARCTVAGDTVTIVSAGTGANGCSITASQGGNAQWQPATPVTRVIDINRAAQEISFNPPASVSSTAQTFSWPPPTGGGSGNPVIVTSLSPDVCTISVAAGNTANIISAGKCDLVANQAGNPNYQPGTANRSVSITPPQ